MSLTITERIALAALLTLLTIFHISIPLTFYCPDPKSLSRVSGYYGPGAFSAWLLTAVATLATNDLCPPPEDELSEGTVDSPSGSNVQITATADKCSAYDAGLIATVAYPVLASADAFSKILSYDNISQLRAALAVAQVAQYVCLVGMWGAQIIQTKPERIRASIWASGAFLCAIAVSLGVARERGTPSLWIGRIILFFQGIPVSMWLGQLVLFNFNSNLKAIPNLPSIVRRSMLFLTAAAGIWAIIGFSAVYMMGQNVDQTQDYRPRFHWAVPRSGASISDLDQASALGVAVICYVALPALLAARDRASRQQAAPR